MVNKAQTETAIAIKNLRKSFGELKVLRGISFSVKPGTILALLGPNGAGKTTTIRILSTLLKPDGGSAQVNGFDVTKEAEAVRMSIGLTGQFAAVDEFLTGEENLEMMGRLYHLSLADTRHRTKELLQQFDLTKDAKRPVKTYSGGMKRKLDLAMSLIASPPVIFLDEPTTGLDPPSRLAMWGMIRKLVAGGNTILLTTQYMEEADQLADRIVVIDNGKLIAEGTATQLKAKVGSDHLDLTISKKSPRAAISKALKGEKFQIDEENSVISIATKGGARKLQEILKALERAKIEVESVNLRRPTLDDVFLRLTGHTTSDDKEQS